MFGKNVRMIDSHFHIRGCNQGRLEELLAVAPEIARALDLETVCVAAIPAWDYDSAGQNVLCALYKALYPSCYAYAGLDHYPSHVPHTGEDYLRQVKLFEAMGFDGIKSIEYKPTARMRLGAGLNDPRFGDCFAYLSQNRTPILWHVADPEENWHAELCSEYVKKAGWCYDGGSFIGKEALYAETEAVLDRFPGLNVVFAHLYFLGADLPRLRAFLDKYPNVRIDVTPGSEMYYHFHRSRDAWRSFFIEYSGRVVFGTDNGWGDETAAAQKVVDGCQKLLTLDAFFSTDQQVKAWDGTLIRGLDLPEAALKQIYRNNFMDMHQGRPPKKINLPLAAEYARDMWEGIKDMREVSDGKKEQLQYAAGLLLHLAGKA